MTLSMCSALGCKGQASPPCWQHCKEKDWRTFNQQKVKEKALWKKAVGLLALIEWSNIEEGETVVFCDQLLVDTANPQLSRLLILWMIVSTSKSLYTSLQCFTRHGCSSHTMATVSVKECVPDKAHEA